MEHRDIVEAMYGRNFHYTTISKLESEGIVCGSETTDMISEPRALMLIRLYSEYINGITGQWFEPYHLTYGIDVKHEIFSMPNNIPILEVFKLSNQSGNLSSGDYRINSRNIVLSNFHRYRLSNYLIDGIFGRIENVRFLETELEEDFDLTTDNSIEVSNISPGNKYLGISGVRKNFQIGDVIIFEIDGEEVARRIVTGIDFGENEISFDKFLDVEIESENIIPKGSIVKTYGRIPMIIEMATVQFVIDNYHKRGSGEFFAEQLKRRIKAEKTDNYSYETHTMKGGGGYALPDITLTSDAVLNRGLMKYAAPGWVKFL
jgi:hypothetical protein